MFVSNAVKVIAISFGTLFILVLCFKLLVKKMITNIRFFTNFSKSFYDYFYSIKKLKHLRTNNFGYAPVDEEIANFDPDLQHGLQLYKETAKGEAGYLIHKGDVVAEISCGKGGGAEYLVTKFTPQIYTGIDFSKKAIEFCKNTYKGLGNMEFICATADKLPFKDNSVDVVINVEASHLYRNAKHFFLEVCRVLKTNGRFLFTDYRCIENYPIEKLEMEISLSGLSIVERKIVTPAIYKACSLESDRREKIIEDVIPRYFHKYFRHYAVLKGTKKFMMMQNGEIVYMMYHIEKVKQEYARVQFPAAG